jgi:hypothetical protein
MCTFAWMEGWAVEIITCREETSISCPYEMLNALYTRYSDCCNCFEQEHFNRGIVIRFPLRARGLFSIPSRQALRPIKKSNQWVQKTLSLGVKRTSCEAEHSPPSTVKVKNQWRYASAPPPQYAFIQCVQTSLLQLSTLLLMQLTLSI